MRSGWDFLSSAPLRSGGPQLRPPFERAEHLPSFLCCRLGVTLLSYGGLGLLSQETTYERGR